MLKVVFTVCQASFSNGTLKDINYFEYLISKSTLLHTETVKGKRD